MKTYHERVNSVSNKMELLKQQQIKRKKLITGTCLTLAVVVLALILFAPYDTTPPDVSMHAASPYYELIQKLNEATYEPPAYTNRFDEIVTNVSKISFGAVFAPNGGAEWVDGDMTAGEYVEVTDNQVDGVIEADIIKRSDKYIYYLLNSFLKVYSIEGEESQLLGQYNTAQCLFPEDWENKSFGYTAQNAQMYLSADCTTVTVLMDSYDERIGSAVLLVNLNVTDPANISTIDYQFFTGQMVSSRMVDGDILLTYNYQVKNADFDQESSFVPSYGKPGSMTCIPADDIICPENVDSARYTVVCRVDGKTLAVEGSAALLSYSQELYVSGDTIFATHAYAQKSDGTEGRYTSHAMTEISGISYASNTLEQLGTVTLEGSVKDQYSMDQHEGILRVVTSTAVSEMQQRYYEDFVSVTGSTKRNVNLYCVDLSDWAVVASVIGFAPEGEQAESVRFDGDTAYVCTAEVVTLTDPVYFFDLSDLSNITYKDTGTIDGYSISLIQLGNGYLLGIGYGDSRQLKIEVYEQTQDGVQSVCVWEENASFSEEYKSYFIDREKGLIGLSLNSWEDYSREYVLLHFDGYGLNELLRAPISQMDNMDRTRAVLIDGYLYLFFCPEADYGKTENTLKVEKVW